MGEKKRAARRAERPPVAATPDLKAQRTEFVHTFFKKGAQLTEELVRENARLRREVARLDGDNARLRTQLAKDKAVHELLRKIEKLEKQRERLLSSVHEAEEATTRFTTRFSEIESELESFATLYVASFQLHSTLRVASVLRHLKELLQQLVGAHSLAIYVADDARGALLPIAAQGVPRATLPTVALQGSEPNGHARAAAILERVFLTGVPHVATGDVSGASLDAPAACVPMRVEDEIVGVIAVFALLPQKREFVPVDRELFKLLGAHAATALVGAQLYERSGGALPSLAALEDATT